VLSDRQRGTAAWASTALRERTVPGHRLVVLPRTKTTRPSWALSTDTHCRGNEQGLHCSVLDLTDSQVHTAPTCPATEFSSLEATRRTESQTLQCTTNTKTPLTETTRSPSNQNQTNSNFAQVISRMLMSYLRRIMARTQLKLHEFQIIAKNEKEQKIVNENHRLN
jgi:hypothetical protein